jgi:LuxR family transcriptional regulator, maltose regulon positive regulatory protein
MKTLIATKTYLPSNSVNLVSRPRLLAMLDSALLNHCRLMLISALAGSGKSTLLAEWASNLKGPVGWLSLDADDNDLYQFWGYIIHAIQSRFPKSCESLIKDLTAAPPPSMKDFLPALINTLADFTSSDGSAPFVIILDDYHAIENEAVHESLTFFLDHLPPDVLLVIATRTDPSLPLHRWRSHGQLIELRSADLRFTLDEAAQFLNDIMGLGLLSEQILQLGARTEGWAVGLQLAALSLRDREDKSAFIQRFSGSHHFVLEYLTNEVISRQPRDIQKFLIQTSILEKLCAELCDSIRGAAEKEDEANSASLLHYLERSNLFLTSLDDERQWYRYHHLFAELLQIRLSRQSKAEVASLHQRAAEWYAAHNFIDEAIQHALVAGNTTFAGDLIIRNWPQMQYQGRSRTILKWIEMLPNEMVRVHPMLSAAQAWSLYLLGQTDQVEEYIEQANQVLASWAARGYAPDDSYDYNSLHGLMAVLQANVFTRKRNYRDGIMAAQEALRVASPQDALVNGLAWISLSHSYEELGDIEEAISSYQQGIQWNLKSHNVLAVSIAARRLSRLFQIQGDSPKAEAVILSILEQTSQSNQAGSPAYGSLYIALGDLSYKRNELEKAQQQLEQGRAQGKLGGYIDLLLCAGLLDAQLKRANGDLPGAIHVLNEISRTIHKVDEPLAQAELCAWQARFQAEAGNLEAASVWAESVLREVGSCPGLTHGIELFTLVRVLLAQKRLEDAHLLAAQLAKTAAITHSAGWESEALMLQAEAFWMQSCPDQALGVLSQAVSIAEPRGFIRLFIEEGQLMDSMLKSLSARSEESCSERASRLLKNFPEEDIETAALVSPVKRMTLSPLSDREIEVLSLVATGLSNPEIAERLVVSTATIKTHVSHIYDKLDAQNRAEAVAHAKEKGLI